MTAGLVKMIRRFNRATGERDSPRIPAKIIHPHPTRPGVRFAKNEFEEESELFLEGLYRDEDFLYLQQTEGDLIVPPPPALATTLGIDGAYYRCPIPESVEKPDLTWARERLLKVVPR